LIVGREEKPPVTERCESEMQDYSEETIRKIVARLKAIGTFSHFSDDVLKEQFLPLCKVVSFEPGSFLIREGETDPMIFFLLAGHVRIVKNNESVYELKRAGDIFGEMTAIDGAPRSASVVAVKPTTCLTLDSSMIDKLEAGPREKFLSVLYRVFAEKLAERLRTANSHIARLKDENDKLKKRVGAANGQ
jgi:CRP-like cAMP-binding protein